MRRRWFFVIALLLAPAPAPAPTPARAEFAIRDGDTVVFLGDSITGARVYGKIIENYTLLRFPDRKGRFINAGLGGDTAAGGLKRLERDVFARGATLVTVAYGINDIGWGMKTDDDHRGAYLDGIRGIVEACQKRGVRVFVCSAAVTAADPNTSEHDVLQSMCDEGMAIARSLGAATIDVQRTMRAIQKKVWEANARLKDESKKETLHAGDGIHLNELGQRAMAFAILKGLGAPAEVSAVTVDAKAAKLLETRGCTVTDLAQESDRLRFTRLDEGLPINFGLFGALAFRYIPFPDELNRYLLQVQNLKPGRYEVVVDDRLVSTYTHEQLAHGVNLSSATANPWEPGGPWECQANVLIGVTDARDNLAVAQGTSRTYVPRNPNVEAIGTQADELNARLEALQRTVVKPSPYHFTVRPAAQDAAR